MDAEYEISEWIVSGALPSPSTPQELAALLKRDAEKWGKHINAQKTTPEGKSGGHPVRPVPLSETCIRLEDRPSRGPLRERVLIAFKKLHTPPILRPPRTASW